MTFRTIKPYENKHNKGKTKKNTKPTKETQQLKQINNNIKQRQTNNKQTYNQTHIHTPAFYHHRDIIIIGVACNYNKIGIHIPKKNQNITLDTPICSNDNILAETIIETIIRNFGSGKDLNIISNHIKHFPKPTHPFFENLYQSHKTNITYTLHHKGQIIKKPSTI